MRYALPLLATLLVPPAAASTDVSPFFVPIVLSSPGAAGSFYTSELTLANKGTSSATVEFVYTASFGEGSGTGTDVLPAGRQKIVPDAIEYLRSLGIPIPAQGARGGTLRVRFSGLSSPADGFVSARTTTLVPEGRAGLAYAGTSDFTTSTAPTAPPLPPSTLVAPLLSGTYRSTNYAVGSADSFPSPAPSPASGTALSVFGGTSPNGTWSLYVVDDDSGDLGRFAEGWCLALVTDDGATTERCNAQSVEIPNVGQATPYPSTIAVSGIAGKIARATVKLQRLTHGCPADIDVLLVGPVGQNVVLMSDAGRCGPYGGARDATLVIDDYATAPVVLFGLRQNATDRSNVALTNAGESAEDSILLHVTVHSGAAGLPAPASPADVLLAPGGFKQLSGILGDFGLSNGWVTVERASGTAPFVAYAVVNDQANSDGSFIPSMPLGAGAGVHGLTLPVVVESGTFTTEVTLANVTTSRKDVSVTYVSDNVQGGTTTTTIPLEAGQQLVLPEFVQYLRDHGAAGIAPRGPTFAGALFASLASGDVSGLLIGGRTSAPGGGGRYGVFYPATAAGGALGFDTAWAYGLRQDAENRTNLAFVNTGETDDSTDTFRVDFFDGESGAPAGSLAGISLPPKGWKQIGSILSSAAPGSRSAYARITRTAGANPYLVYTVTNDGGGPGQRSGDGAYLPATLDPFSLGFAGSWSGVTNEGKPVSLTATGSQVTAFSMPIVLSYGSLRCTPVLGLPAPAPIVGTGATLSTASADHPGPAMSGLEVALTFTSSTTATGTLGTITLAGGLICDGGFVVGTSTVVNGPWSFSVTRR